MHERTERLLQLMAKYELTDADVARIVRASETTVAIWRCKNPERIIPERALRLLEAEMILQAAKVSA